LALEYFETSVNTRHHSPEDGIS